MYEKIKSALDQIHAEDTLQENTLRYVFEKTNGYRRGKSRFYRSLAPIAACLLAAAFGVGGYLSYVTPVAAISLDINPSIELEMNIYDRVISSKGYNDQGVALAEELNVRHMNYSDAVQALLESDAISDCLKTGEPLEVTVTSDSEQKSQAMQDRISDQTEIPLEQFHCSGHHEQIDQAHAAGLSTGRYRALLELQAVDPEITAQDVQGLTMAQIRALLENASQEDLQHHDAPAGDVGDQQDETDPKAEPTCAVGRGHGGSAGEGAGHHGDGSSQTSNHDGGGQTDDNRSGSGQTGHHGQGQAGHNDGGSGNPGHKGGGSGHGHG